jgi:DNA invertase Pin-like site-specific DNA recombinase
MKCAIYTRQSSASGNQALSSCDVQFDLCYSYLKSQHGEGWEWIGERLDDVGESGADTNRPALWRLCALVEQGAIQKVLIYRLDRLARNLLDCLRLLKTFREAGVQLHIVTAPDIGTGATDSLVLNLMATFSEFEHQMICERLADMRRALKLHGRRLAGRVPYGYDADRRTRQFTINRKEARRVEAMFHWAADGMLPRDIAAKATESGWRTKVTIAKRSKRRSGGNRWTPRQVLSILNNPVYLGRFADEPLSRWGQHKAIVSEDLFERVRSQIAARRTPKGPRRETVPYAHLRGKVLCPTCRRPMSIQTMHRRMQPGGAQRTFYYRCRSYAGGRPPCKGPSLYAYELDSRVAELIATTGTGPKGALDPCFRMIWGALDWQTQKHLLPHVVRQVVFDEKASSLTVEFDEAAVQHITDTLIDADLARLEASEPDSG